MKSIKIFIALAGVLISYSATAQLQVGSTGFMIHPGDEEPPIGVYPNKTEGETDSLENDTKEKVKDKKKASKDMNGKPIGTIYWNEAERRTAEVCKIAEEGEKTKNNGNPLDDKDVGKAGSEIYNTVSEVYDNVVDYFFPPDNKSTTTTDNSTAQCTRFEVLLTDKPATYKKTIGKQINKLAQSKKWNHIQSGYFYISKNKTKKYAYIYFVKNKPSRTNKQAAFRYKVRVKKNKIILFPFN